MKAESKCTTAESGERCAVDRGKNPTATSCVANWALVSARKRPPFPTDPVLALCGSIKFSALEMSSRSTSAATPSTEQIRAIIMKTPPSNAKRRFAEVAPCPNELAY